METWSAHNWAVATGSGMCASTKRAYTSPAGPSGKGACVMSQTENSVPGAAAPTASEIYAAERSKPTTRCAPVSSLTIAVVCPGPHPRHAQAWAGIDDPL